MDNQSEGSQESHIEEAQEVQDLLTINPLNKCNRKQINARRTREYLIEFDKFLENKLNQRSLKPFTASAPVEQENIQPHSDGIYANQFSRHKPFENTPEARLNRMLHDFKQLDTYVNVKQFVEEINAANKVQNRKPDSNLNKGIRQRRFYDHVLPDFQIWNNCSEQWRDLLEKIHYQLKPMVGHTALRKIGEMQQLYHNFDEMLENCDPQSLQRSQAIELQSFLEDIQKGQKKDKQSEEATAGIVPRCGRSVPRTAKKMVYLFDELAPPKIDDMYYSEYQHHIQAISKQMRHTLNSIHEQKWNKRNAQNKDRNLGINRKKAQQDILKPIISEKYRSIAPKNIFRFRVGKHVYSQSHEQSPKIHRNNNNFSQNIKAKHLRPLQSQISDKVTRFKTSVKANTPKKRRHFGSISNLQNQTILHNISEIKTLYRFRKPMIKQGLLKKVGDFIRLTEDQQLQLRKSNQEISNMITKAQTKKRLDFDRFNAETVEIDMDDIQRFSKPRKKRSIL